MIEQCNFDKNGVCYALVCYSSFKCEARDEEGNPIYTTEVKDGQVAD